MISDCRHLFRGGLPTEIIAGHNPTFISMKIIMLHFQSKECLHLPEQTKPDRKLDCLGLYCPEPVFRTRMELDNMKIGEVLEVLADDPAAEEDIKSLCKRLGQQLLDLSKEGSTLRFLIKKVK